MQNKHLIRLTWNVYWQLYTNFGIGSSFMNCITILYTSPKACVRTNQTSSRYSLQRGTRQGCPLSSSLFAVSIEPLAAAIRQTKNIKGIESKNVKHIILIPEVPKIIHVIFSDNKEIKLLFYICCDSYGFLTETQKNSQQGIIQVWVTFHHIQRLSQIPPVSYRAFSGDTHRRLASTSVLSLCSKIIVQHLLHELAIVIFHFCFFFRVLRSEQRRF